MSVYQRGRNFWIQYYVAGKAGQRVLGAISATDAKIVEAERLKAVRLGLASRAAARRAQAIQ